MKKAVLMLAVGGLMLATPSCKKGENDPALSLSSRKARISGAWDVTGYESATTNTEADGDYQSSVSTMSGDVITTTWTDYDASNATTTSSSSTKTLNEGSYVINKDGTFELTWNTTTVSTSTVDVFGGTFTTVTTTVQTSSETGNWSFVGKVKDVYANKERVVLNTLSHTWTSQSTSVTTNTFDSTVDTNNGDLNTGTDTYHSGEWTMTYEIDQLKGKEMIWKVMENNTGTNSTTPFGGSTTTTTDDVYTADQTITFTAVK